MADATVSEPPFGGSIWFFYAPLTDVKYTLTVFDQLRGGAPRSYSNVSGGPGELCGGADTEAFPFFQGSWSASFTSSDPNCFPLAIPIDFHQKGDAFRAFYTKFTDSTRTDYTFEGTITGTTLRGTYTENYFAYPDRNCIASGAFTGIVRSPNEIILSIPLIELRGCSGSNPQCSYTVRVTR